ncbi:hypothetical protein KIH27_13040 [Mycobacterium sp. M1]|uniref:Porin n=1 Tax=Mycolicibacter acidiphilus TaxID=2835306 RepID=A0ABS5RJN3_9MYCO|nr:hypothetical protein [Mycolicibacter acidiphilus]MBS9534512.1 hypothetical protein [Mycolicibacter acidiphilus]
MDIRKIGVVGAFAAGAALALAPLAAAETETPAFDWAPVLNSQIQSMNWLFATGASLGGFGSDDFVQVGTGKVADGGEAFDTILKSTILGDDDNTNNLFGSFLGGVNWEDQFGSTIGSFHVFNGALVQFTDASNVLLYALVNDGAQIDAADASNYLFGNAGGTMGWDAALSGDSVWADASNFMENGINDMMGYWGLDSIDFS